jgi:hypothetical protein
VNNAEEAEPSKNGEEGSAAGSQSAFVPVKEGEVEATPTEQVQEKEGPKEANDKGEESEEEDGEATVEGPSVEELDEDDAAAPVTDSKTPANEATARLQAAFEVRVCLLVCVCVYVRAYVWPVFRSCPLVRTLSEI